MNINEQFADWHHNSKWVGFYSQLTVEYRNELTRLVIRKSKSLPERFHITPELAKLIGLKEVHK